MKLSVIIPTYNEAGNIEECLLKLLTELENNKIPHEILVIDGNSSDKTAEKVSAFSRSHSTVRLIQQKENLGIGNALKEGFARVTGDCVVPFMADLSDDPEDMIQLYQKMREGYDAVYTNRFISGGGVFHYPRFKLFLNRIFNHLTAWLFFFPFTDMTNAFKAYKADIIRQMKLKSDGFEILIEIPLKAFLLGKKFAQIPVRWTGRKEGVSKLKLLKMGPRYFKVLFSLLKQRWLR